MTVELHGVWCARHVVGEHAAFARDIARRTLLAVEDERLARVDLAADVVGLPVARIGRRAWLSRGACKVSQYGGETVEGWTVGKRGDLYLRVYDKTLELDEPRNVDKREEEHERLRALGWDGEAPVTRVEYELTSDVLSELNVRHPDQFLERIDAVWKYATRARRLVSLRTASRPSRCRTDPRWRVVQLATFGRDDGEVAVRMRRPSRSASARRTLSAVLNYGVDAGVIAPVDLHDATGKLRPASEVVEALSGAAADRRTREWLVRCASAAVSAAVDEMQRNFGGRALWADGARKTFAHVIEKVNARHARRGTAIVPDEALERAAIEAA